ncbi:transcriptional regulator, AraC family [Chitinophaga sp. YR573]|uniref:helix-turn-helix transcriptional regulator n=1 Tax=Chitinophaga sp. YR573 TaxID=1881040 RepID=UPI0008B27B9B|nr:helix-turn-helix transcriptional regulator [Chitinophaga sp. YR573]SEV87951.1 transcriptional regulator, AraC family [Chitinophaga sp. YR573]
MQLLPSPVLSNIVKHFLILESDTNVATDHRFFPDGNSGMTFHFGDPFIDGPLQIKHPRSFVYGQISKFHNVISNGRIGILVVVFQPYGAYSLLNIPAHELTDTIISLQDLWGSEVNILEESILHANNNLDRISLIEKFLIKKLHKTPDVIIEKAVNVVYQHHGLISMGQLTGHMQIGERLLERKFRENIGISPKNFAGTIRLQYFLKLLRNKSSDTNLTKLAYECGYYDQAHLIREFRKQVGITPGKYISAANLLAVNFIQI